LERRFRTITYCIALLFFISCSVLNAQILRDSVSLLLVKAGIEDIYNFRFSEAENVCKTLKKSYPEHPVVYLLQGMIKYWENFPLIPSSEMRLSYERDMRKCIELCEDKKNKAETAEFLLANLSARGMLLLFYADNNLSGEVIPLATSTYQYIMRSFNYTSSYSDFYFFTGLYNYYRERYPEVYPIYSLVVFMFPKGDKTEGLNELNTVAANSILLKAEASSFLSGIYSSFENDFRKAADYSKSLHELYLNNLQYLALYIKNLLLTKKYDEAEKLIISASGHYSNNSYYHAEFTILSGILHEKKYNNTKLAEQYYLNGIEEMAAFGHFGNEFSAYAYFGLSRVSENKEGQKTRKDFRRKALELADFKNIDFD
jgi:hypothetical protein